MNGIQNFRRNLFLSRFAIFICMTSVAIWFVFIPWKVNLLSMTETQLGFVFMIFGLGSLISIQVTNRILLRQYSAENLIRLTLPLFPITFYLWTSSISYGNLLLYALPLSLCFGIINSSVLSATLNYEKLTGRRFMPMHQASFSIGGLTGSVLGGVLINFIEQPETSILFVSVSSFSAIIILVSNKVTQIEPINERIETSMPSRLSLILGIMAAINLGTVGIILDWSALWLTREFSVAAALGGAIIFAFTSGEIISRVTGEKLINHFGEKVVGSYFMLVGCAVLFCTILLGRVEMVIIGFFIFGLLTANYFPILLGLGSKLDPKNSQKVLGDINLLAFGGLVFGPMLVGFIADMFSINTIMYVLTVVWAVLGVSCLPLFNKQKV